jgi:diguanylate cyclase (GGDEF)-like protein
MLDIDHFRSFNDNYGHLTGDQVLRLVGQSLKQIIKGRDTMDRYGGEEFAVVLPDTDLPKALAAAEQIAPRGHGKRAEEEVHRRNSWPHRWGSRCCNRPMRGMP